MIKRTWWVPFLLLFLFSNSGAQGLWELKKSQNGIDVYSRKPLNGTLKELRVICELEGNENQLIAALMDVAGYSNWVYGNKRSVILKKTGAESIIYFSEVHLCWPLKDRDLIIDLNITHKPEDGSLFIQAKSLPGYRPLKDGFVRVPYSLAQWNVTPLAENKLKVEYTLSVDPGGSIPSWLVNATLAIGPYNSFVKLRDLLKEKAANRLVAVP